MGIIKQINIKNRTYYLYNDIIDLKNFDARLLKIDKNSCKDIGIYNIGYITIIKIDDYESIYSVNSLYLIILHASGFWFLTLQMKTKSNLKNSVTLLMELATKSKSISSDKCDYEKD